MSNCFDKEMASDAEPLPSAFDAVPLEDQFETDGPAADGRMAHRFYAFNTDISLLAYGDEAACRTAFDEVREACRTYERLFSRTLPHSDISRLNSAEGSPVSISADTAELLQIALQFCAESEEYFDITIGVVSRLWDFAHGVIPDRDVVQQELAHVNWRGVQVWCDEGSGNWLAQLDDPQAAVDAGGIAKGWIADKLTDLMEARGLASFVINLGGNVAARGSKPDGSAWQVGLQDPRNKGALIGSVAVRNASSVASGVYERCFEKDSVRYHHILDPKTGFPVQTDVESITVITPRSIDAEGYSTTLLALGVKRGCEFVRAHPQIIRAIFVTNEGKIVQA